MLIPSVLLEQHIGNMNAWIECTMARPQAKELKDLGCRFDSDFTLIDIQTKIRYTPEGIRGKLVDRSPEELIRIATVFEKYLGLLSVLDQYMVKQAALLPTRLEQLDFSLACEQVKPGGKLWWKNGKGVFWIEFIEIKNKKAKFRYVNDEMCKEEEAYLPRMKLYLNKHDIFLKEGYDVTKR